MTRAALLPAGSDPFLLAYWLRNFATWSQYVDELHVAVCGVIEPEPLAYMRDITKPYLGAGGTFTHIAKRTDHGATIGLLLGKTRADHIMLCEDDAYIREPSMVEESFRFAEDNDGIAATPRGGYASNEVIGAAGAALGETHSYWPCFVFVARKHLLATDRKFGGVNWYEGDVVLGRRLNAWAGADTFVWASYQLRAMGLPEFLRDNHRLSGQTVPDDAPWFHVGSLSSGHGYMFMSDMPDIQYREEVIGFHRLPEGNAAQRFAWWWRVWNKNDGEIDAYHHRYGDAWEKFRADCEIPERDIEAAIAANNRLITWAER